MKVIHLFLVAFLLLGAYSALAGEAKVIRLRGKVLADGKPLKKNHWVKEGQVIEAIGKKSFAQLRFGGGSSFLIKDGKIKLKIMKEKKTLISLLKGTMFANKKKKDGKFNVKTKYASMAVRGTKFFVMQGEDTYLCVCEGTVALKNKKGLIDVNKSEDVHSTGNNFLEKTPAAKFMWSMAAEGFNLMGIDIGPYERAK